VTRPELDSTLRALLALKAPSDVTTSTLTLGPHPMMVREGLAGAFATGAKRIVLEHLAASKLVKITFLHLLRTGNDWDLEQFERKDGQYVLTDIPSLPPTVPDARGACSVL
jgi:hypothetical protein